MRDCLFRSQIIDTDTKKEIEKNVDGTVTSRSIIEIMVTRFDHLATIECGVINIAMQQPLVQSIEMKVLCAYFFFRYRLELF